MDWTQFFLGAIFYWIGTKIKPGKKILKCLGIKKRSGRVIFGIIVFVIALICAFAVNDILRYLFGNRMLAYFGACFVFGVGFGTFYNSSDSEEGKEESGIEEEKKSDTEVEKNLYIEEVKKISTETEKNSFIEEKDSSDIEKKVSPYIKGNAEEMVLHCQKYPKKGSRKWIINDDFFEIHVVGKERKNKIYSISNITMVKLNLWKNTTSLEFKIENNGQFISRPIIFLDKGHETDVAKKIKEFIEGQLYYDKQNLYQR